LTFIKKYVIILKKHIFFLEFPVGLTLYKKYVIIIMEENNNKPVGTDSSDRPFYFIREAICGFPVGPPGGLALRENQAHMKGR
jgi:hypothetical protein